MSGTEFHPAVHASVDGAMRVQRPQSVDLANGRLVRIHDLMCLVGR